MQVDFYFFFFFKPDFTIGQTKKEPTSRGRGEEGAWLGGGGGGASWDGARRADAIQGRDLGRNLG